VNASSISHEIRRDGMTRSTYYTNRAQIGKGKGVNP
jgi:hypothetical protein